jgi:hypothetical protein
MNHDKVLLSKSGVKVKVFRLAQNIGHLGKVLLLSGYNSCEDSSSDSTTEDYSISLEEITLADGL